MHMRKEDGTCAMSDEDNAEVFGPHFTKVFNRNDAPVDWTILDEISQRPELTHLGEPPTPAELDRALTKLSNNKAPGASLVPPEAVKASTPEIKAALLQCFHEFWAERANPEEWHTALLKCLWKGKGDLSNPNTWRGICLQDLIARVLSSIVTFRLNEILKTHGIANQFGCQPGVGCIDGLFSIRSALQLRRQFNLPTWALFVDLVKAFDTSNHELLFALLEKYGAPPPLVSVVRRLYENNTLELRIGKAKRSIP